MDGHNESGMVGKVVPTNGRLGHGMADHFRHPRFHATSIPIARYQYPHSYPHSTLPVSPTRTHALIRNCICNCVPATRAPNHQTRDSRLASHSLTDQWLVQRRRIYRLALPKSGLYVHTMP